MLRRQPLPTLFPYTTLFRSLADRALGDELVDGDAATLMEQLTDPVEVDDLVLLAEGVLEPLQLGQAHVQGQLAALEVRRDVVAGLGTLGAATGGLALGSLTATHAGLGGLGARGRAQVVQLERHLDSSSPITPSITWTVTR